MPRTKKRLRSALARRSKAHAQARSRSCEEVERHAAASSGGGGGKPEVVCALPPLLEAARLVQFRSQYVDDRVRGRICALLASLRVTCETFLQLAGVCVGDEGAPKHAQMVKVFTETHVRYCMMVEEQIPKVRWLEFDSLLQLAFYIAKQYIVEVYRHRSGVRREESRVSPPAVPMSALSGELPRSGVSAFKAFRKVGQSKTSSESGTTEDDGEESSGVDHEVAEFAAANFTDSENESMSGGEDTESSEDEYEFCRNVDGKSEAQCQCYACVLGDKSD